MVISSKATAREIALVRALAALEGTSTSSLIRRLVAGAVADRLPDLLQRADDAPAAHADR